MGALRIVLTCVASLSVANGKLIPKPQSSQRLAGALVGCGLWKRWELGSNEHMDYFIDSDLGFLCSLLGHWVPSSNILT